MSATCPLVDVFKGAQCFQNGGYAKQQLGQRKAGGKQHSISAEIQSSKRASLRIGQNRFLAGGVSLEGVGRPRSGSQSLKGVSV